MLFGSVSQPVEFISGKNTDTVDINIKSADAYSGKRFFQNICKSVVSVDWVGNPTFIKVVWKFSDNLFANSSRPV